MNSVALALMVSTLFLAGCSTAHHQMVAKGTRIVILAPDQAEAELKKHADDGWTCVGAITGTPVSPMDKLRGYMLVRQKQ